AAACRIEGAAGVRWMLVLHREPAHGAEAREDHWMHAGFGPAREDDVRVAALDQLRALADRMRSGRAGGDDGVVRAADAERDSNLPARGVDEHVGQEERRNAIRPALAEHLGLVEHADDP